MTEKRTELVFILDRSGSMSGLESDTIGGFNAMLKKQRKEEGECLVSTILFDHHFKVLHDRVPLSEVKDMTEEDYQVGGATALVDAIGRSIHHIGNIHKYARREDVPDSTLFVITTDGMENASKQYSASEVRKMIRRQEEKYGWQFLFVGANIDAVETADCLGIRKENAVNYHADEAGTAVVYENISKAVGFMRKMGKVSADWSREINEDYEARKK